MPQHRYIEELEIQAYELEKIIERFKANRGEMLRLRRGASAQIKALLAQRLAVNTQTLNTLTTRLETVGAELRRERATHVHGGVEPSDAPRR